MPFRGRDGTLQIRLRSLRPIDENQLFARTGSVIQPVPTGVISGIATRTGTLIQLKASPTSDSIYTVTGTLIQLKA